jgi:nitronate monooxygenase
MLNLEDLRLPLVAAPMAGGPSTPELVAAAGRVGALGFLAGGYLSAETLAARILRTRELSDAPFGVNLFVPAPRQRTTVAPEVLAYRRELEADAHRRGVELPDPDPADRDDYNEKIALLLDDPVAVVSFTFGLPDPETVRRLQGVGTHVAITVTELPEALAAAAGGADSLVVQGSGAGGHRGTHLVTAIPDATPLLELVRTIVASVGRPVIAAGGVADGRDVAALLDAGASAVAVGTLLLRTAESGAPAAHKDALAIGGETRVTRAFSGRLARALVNRFVREHDADAPAFYPEVNQLTRPLRAAASGSGDADGLALWAGTGFASARAVGADEVLLGLQQG